MKDLDQLLREDARLGFDDDGFTARVMAGLPAAAAARARAWLKPALVMGSAALGCLLAVVLSPLGTAVVGGFWDLMHLRTGSPGAVASIALCGALLASAIVLALED